jgi:hypothetical protein
MLGSFWDVVLTIAFAFTFVVCLGHLVQRRFASRATGAPLSDDELIDINHGLMSIAMIVMTWLTVLDIITYAQIALFVVLALSLVPVFGRAKAARRVDLVGHVLLDGAMIWMLAAMPLLMAGAINRGGDSVHAAHHGGGDILTATPIWADVVNVLAVAISAVAAVWWICRLVTERHHRLHTLCHIVMAAGMSGMLFLMNSSTP